MCPADVLDAVIIGSGPNGLAAAMALALAGRRVRVLEGASDLGGGMRSRALTLEGFTHDVCSAVHPLAVSSPFLKTLSLEAQGLKWIHPPVPVAHPLTSGGAAFLSRDPADVDWVGLDRPGRESWQGHIGWLVERWDDLVHELLQPPLRLPRHPLLMLRFALRGVQSASVAGRRWFADESMRALFGGLAAHAMLPLSYPGTCAYALLLGAAAHAVGWPIPQGGSQQLANALARALCEHGVEFETGRFITSWSELPPARAYVFDTSPRMMLKIAGDRLPARYHRKVNRFRHGMGVFKVDWALHQPIPWQADVCRRAGTVHVGGTLQEIERSEHDAWIGRTSEAPFVLVAQPSLFDATRAPTGRHTAWAYCHVPSGSNADMTNAIESQIERFAPGFRDCILARHTMNAQQMEQHNPNYVGGDINGGAATVRQTIARPVLRRQPYATPNPQVFLCSASTPPGGGVHGMCGFHAAQAVLRSVLRQPS